MMRLFLTLMLTLVACGGSEEKEVDPEVAAGRMRTRAWTMAQIRVESQLKAPATARWGSLLGGDYQNPDDCVLELRPGRFHVTGWVDSENSFGALIRTRFRMILERSGPDDWRVVEGTEVIR